MLEQIRGWGRPLLLEAGEFMEVDLPTAAQVNALILDRLEAEGAPAITPGPRELEHWAEFESALKGRAIPVVSSNLIRREAGTDQPIGSASAVIAVAGVPVGLLGILGGEAYAKIKPAPGVEYILRDPAVAIRELLPELRRRAEIVVVIGCLTDGEAAALAPIVPGVDLWISGYDSTPSDRPVRVGATLLDRPGQRGQYLSVTHLIVSPTGAIVDWGGRNIPLDAKTAYDRGVDSLVARVTGGTMGSCH
jgi:2',3'-cyclic-nucleotide 2'-phosphodiesterase (5'-nucleotidase family)